MSQFLGVGFAQLQATAPTRDHAAVAQMPPAEAVWTDLMEGNQRFVSGKTK